MENILYIDSCVRKGSRTDMLARYVLEKLDGKIHELRLEDMALTPLDGAALDKRTALTDSGNFSDDMFIPARQFAAADIIVISAPYWDLSFPSMVKVYFEHINILGITFEYSENGIPVSLCKAKKLIYVSTSGGPVYGSNMGFDYVKAIAESFYGIKDILYFDAQGLDIAGSDVDAAMENAKIDIDKSM